VKIRHLHIQTPNLAAMAEFYGGVLRFPTVDRSPTHATFAVGESLLSLESSASPAFYHIAFLAARPLYDVLKTELSRACGLLTDGDGASEFVSNMWKGQQFYFEDPDGNVLEIISPAVANSGQSWIRIQEVGMPVPNVRAFTDSLSQVENAFPLESDTFCFYGDNDGVFVVVKEHRPWFPTNCPATIHPIDVEVSGRTRGLYQDDILPYTVVIAP
jgi:catechol 2,3-dioxygenase-like lactoylglutathione lyase family enzyme